jgi:hypothetical protein
MLARAGYSERFIIDMIIYKQTQFDVSADGLVWLAKQGLSEKIIRVMVKNERKEEMTAVLPGAVMVAPLPAPVGQRATGGEKKTVNLEIEVAFPTSAASNSSGSMTGAEQGWWYVAPNVPAIAVSAR